MGLESSLFAPSKSPYNRAALRSFLGSRLGEAQPDASWHEVDKFQLSKPQFGVGRDLMSTSTAPQLSPYAETAKGAQPQSLQALQNVPTGQGSDVARNSFDSSVYDPVLSQIAAARRSDLAQAENDALGGKRSALQQFGDRALAEKELGAGDPILSSISDNPDASQSTLARIARAYRSSVKENEDAMNEANLFYSGYRGQRLKDLSQQRTEQESDASKALQDTLQSIGKALLEAKGRARDQDLADRESAFRDRLARNIPGNGTGTNADNPLGDATGQGQERGLDSWRSDPDASNIVLGNGQRFDLSGYAPGQYTLPDGTVVQVRVDGWTVISRPGGSGGSTSQVTSQSAPQTPQTQFPQRAPV